MDSTGRIRRVSGVFQRVSTAVIVAIPVLVAGYWLAFDELPGDMVAGVLPPGMERPLGGSARLLAGAASLVPASVLLYGFTVLRRLFGLYRQGQVFSPAVVDCYRRLGRTLLAWGAALFLHTPLLTLAMSSSNPPGRRMISLGIGTGELTAAFLGGLALLVSWVMDEGRKLEEEQSFTV